MTWSARAFLVTIITGSTTKIAFQKIINDKKELIEKAGSSLIEKINSLPEKEPSFPLSETAPVSFFSGMNKYYIRTRYLLDRAQNNIIFICGFLIKNEEELLKKYVAKKLKEKVEIKMIYGGPFSDIIKKEDERVRA